MWLWWDASRSARETGPRNGSVWDLLLDRWCEHKNCQRKMKDMEVAPTMLFGISTNRFPRAFICFGSWNGFQVVAQPIGWCTAISSSSNLFWWRKWPAWSWSLGGKPGEKKGFWTYKVGFKGVNRQWTIHFLGGNRWISTYFNPSPSKFIILHGPSNSWLTSDPPQPLSWDMYDSGMKNL